MHYLKGSSPAELKVDFMRVRRSKGSSEKYPPYIPISTKNCTSKRNCSMEKENG